MEWGKFIGLTLLYGYWALLAVVLVFILFRWWKETSPVDTLFRTFFGKLYSSHTKLDSITLNIGVVWLCIISVGIFIAFRHLDYSSVLSKVLKDILIVGLMALAYHAGKYFACFYDKRWANYLIVYLGVCILTLIAWFTHGTHVEDADPVFGGGTRVVDFEPTETERSNAAGHVFFALLPAALFGVYRGQNSAERKNPGGLNRDCHSQATPKEE